MTQHLDTDAARSQFDQFMERARHNHERFIVEDGGEPAVVIIGMEDFIRSLAPAPDWLKNAWARADDVGLDGMSMAEIDAEIDAARADQAARDQNA